MALEVSLTKMNHMPVIQLSGRVIDVDAKKLVRMLDTLYKKTMPIIVLDVTNTDFIDSHGLGTVVYYHTLMVKASRELVILNSNANPNAYLNRLFELTHLNKVLRIVPSLEGVGPAAA
jgi:anti-anti-sigma factor